MKTRSLTVDITTGDQKIIEVESDAMTEAEGIAAMQAAERAAEIAAIKSELDANDLKIVRALIDGDAEKIAAHRQKQAELRAKLK